MMSSPLTLKVKTEDHKRRGTAVYVPELVVSTIPGHLAYTTLTRSPLSLRLYCSAPTIGVNITGTSSFYSFSGTD